MRLQEFIELVRAENSLRAITYARKYLAPWGATHMKELQRVMATLAFRSNTECATYKVNLGSLDLNNVMCVTLNEYTALILNSLAAVSLLYQFFTL